MTDAEVARWFRPVPEGDRAALRALVARTGAALRALELGHVLYGGALLGSLCYADLLPWDDDADLLVHDPVHPDDLRTRLAAALPDLAVTVHAPRLLKVAAGTSAVDIGFLYRSGGLWCHDSVWGGTDTFPLDHITPTARGRLGAIAVSVPAKAAAVCRRKYGPECLTTAMPPAFDHRAERPTGFPAVRVPLERIDRVLRAGVAPAAPEPPAEPSSCAVIVPSGRVCDPAFEAALAELNARGYPVRRVRQPDAPPGFRDRMVTDALAAGAREVLLLDPTCAFEPDAVERLRGHRLPFACGAVPNSGRMGMACAFEPAVAEVRFGTGGGPRAAHSAALAFALVRRAVFDAIAERAKVEDREAAFFAPLEGTGTEAEDAAFCARALKCGFGVVVDTSVRVWRVGAARLGWEDAAGERPRHPALDLRLIPGAPAAPVPTVAPAEPAGAPAKAESLRVPAVPLPEGFPRLGLFVVTYPANAESLRLTLDSTRASDWGAEPVVVTQPADWPVGRESGARTYKLALEAAARSGCDLAVILEDDVRVNKHLRRNLLANPLVARDGCDHLGLFVPDLIADPWERVESPLGYRLAKPRYTGPNRLWERNRLWGAQGYLLSARFVRAALDRWDRLREGQDTRVLGTCAELNVPLWYTAPCLVEHAPLRSAFGTPDARAPDFDPAFVLELGAGFRPPDGVPGWFSRAEAELLWRAASGKSVLELGTAWGRSTVCAAQSAVRVLSVDVADQSEAAEWCRRFGVADRVTFARGDVADVCARLRAEHAGPFELVFVDTGHDAASVARDLDCALALLAPGGQLAFHDYPDPGWPDVRRVVDARADRHGWHRTAQADYLAVFAT